MYTEVLQNDIQVVKISTCLEKEKVEIVLGYKEMQVFP